MAETYQQLLQRATALGVQAPTTQQVQDASKLITSPGVLTQPTSGLGSTALTNQYLKEASQVTGIPATTFTETPQQPVQLPPTPTDTTNYNAMVSGGNAATTSATTPTPNALPDYLQKYLDTSTPPPNPMDSYNSTYANSGIDQRQTAVNESTNKINALKAQLEGINAEQTSQELQMRGQGISAGAIRGRDINLERENAIRALPIQASIIAEQATLTGNEALLQQAQQKFDQVFQIQTNYAKQLYDYNQSLRDAVYNYADKNQQRLLDAQAKQDQNNFTLLQNNLNYAQNLASSALTTGQGDLARQIVSLDPHSATYQQQLASLAGQIKQKADWSSPYVDPTTGNQVQKNNTTGEIRVLNNPPQGTQTSNEPLSPTVIQQYQYDYPDAGIKAGDTFATAQAKINAQGQQTVDLTGATYNGLTVTLKDGSSLTFPDQKSLDQFKTDNGSGATATPTSPYNTSNWFTSLFGK